MNLFPLSLALSRVEETEVLHSSWMRGPGCDVEGVPLPSDSLIVPLGGLSESRRDSQSSHFVPSQILALDSIAAPRANVSISARSPFPRRHERRVFLDGPLNWGENEELSCGTTFFHPELGRS